MYGAACSLPFTLAAAGLSLEGDACQSWSLGITTMDRLDRDGLWDSQERLTLGEGRLQLVLCYSGRDETGIR